MPKKVLNQSEEIRLQKERVRWAINYICNYRQMTNEKIAKDMKRATSTINSYRCMITKPGMDFLIYMQKYNFSLDWFTSGYGEPYPGAAEKFPEVCGPLGVTKDQEYQITESMHSQAKEAIAECSSNRKINIDDAQGKAYRVLSAGTALSVALYMNIQQFAAALDTSHELKVCQDQMKDMQEQINTLNQKMDRLTAVPTTVADPIAGLEEKGT
jgi:uncharacterized protein YjlB